MPPIEAPLCGPRFEAATKVKGMDSRSRTPAPPAQFASRLVPVPWTEKLDDDDMLELTVLSFSES